MNYARTNEGDVYAYLSSNYHIHISYKCNKPLAGKEFRFNNLKDFYDKLIKLKQSGYNIPDRAIKRSSYELKIKKENKMNKKFTVPKTFIKLQQSNPDIDKIIKWYDDKLNSVYNTMRISASISCFLVVLLFVLSIKFNVNNYFLFGFGFFGALLFKVSLDIGYKLGMNKKENTQ